MENEIVTQENENTELATLQEQNQISTIWNDEKLYFLLENGDLPAIIENQRLSKLKLRNMSNTYRENIAFLVNDIDKDIGEKKIKSIIKEL